MATAGPNGPMFGGNDTSVGTIAWVNPTNVQVADGIYATASMTSAQVSFYLVADQFGFSIPSTATINGILVEVLCQMTGTAVIQDNSVRLMDNTGPIGTDKAVASNWPVFPAEAYRSYGGSAILWGLTPAPADVNAGAFGVGVSAINNGPSPGIAYIDYIRITITYTMPGNQVKQQTIVAQAPRAAYDLTQRPD